MIARLIGIAAGIWLMFSPAVFEYVDTTAEASDRIVGPLAATVAFVAVWGVVRAVRWLTLPLGAYCLVGPLLLGFPTDAIVSNLVAGAVIVATTFVRGSTDERYGGGWLSLRGRESVGSAQVR